MRTDNTTAGEDTPAAALLRFNRNVRLDNQTISMQLRAAWRS
jgi:hypothetical protein